MLVTEKLGPPRQGLYVGTSHYAKRHGMTQEKVRRWCRQGKLEALWLEGGTYWLVWDEVETRHDPAP